MLLLLLWQSNVQYQFICQTVMECLDCWVSSKAWWIEWQARTQGIWVQILVQKWKNTEWVEVIKLLLQYLIYFKGPFKVGISQFWLGGTQHIQFKLACTFAWNKDVPVERMATLTEGAFIHSSGNFPPRSTAQSPLTFRVACILGECSREEEVAKSTSASLNIDPRYLTKGGTNRETDIAGVTADP